MDNHAKKNLEITTPKQQGCKYLHRGSSVLSVAAILLTIALFVRNELVVREITAEMKMMDSKFWQEIQDMKDSLKVAAKPQASANKNAANGANGM